jgi:undecaprenyl-diphosphatase
MDVIKPFLDYFSTNPEWALVIIFFVAMGEALLIIGLFVPSTAILVGAGVLIGTGHLNFWPVIIVTTLGAILGDQLSYWAGRYFGESLKTLWPLNRYTQLAAKGEDFVREHGGKSVAIGRFVPGVKSVVPGVVGMLGMNQAFFLFVNVTSAVVWAFVHVLPGVLIGQGLAFAHPGALIHQDLGHPVASDLGTGGSFLPGDQGSGRGQGTLDGAGCDTHHIHGAGALGLGLPGLRLLTGSEPEGEKGHQR